MSMVNYNVYDDWEREKMVLLLFWIMWEWITPVCLMSFSHPPVKSGHGLTWGKWVQASSRDLEERMFFLGGCCSFQIFIRMSFQPMNDSWLKRRVRGGVLHPKSGSGFTSISLTASTVKTTLSGQSCILNVARIWIYPNICISDWLYLWTVGINVCVCECEWRATNFLPG